MLQPYHRHVNDVAKQLGEVCSVRSDAVCLGEKHFRLHYSVSSVLIGWYLMAAPIRGGAVELRAPLTEWNIEGRYDSAADCRDAKDQETKAVISPQTGWSVSSNDAEKRATIKAIQAEKCVASKDPRL